MGWLSAGLGQGRLVGCVGGSAAPSAVQLRACIRPQGRAWGSPAAAGRVKSKGTETGRGTEGKIPVFGTGGWRSGKEVLAQGTTAPGQHPSLSPASWQTCSLCCISHFGKYFANGEEPSLLFTSFCSNVLLCQSRLQGEVGPGTHRGSADTCPGGAHPLDKAATVLGAPDSTHKVPGLTARR